MTNIESRTTRRVYLRVAGVQLAGIGLALTGCQDRRGSTGGSRPSPTGTTAETDLGKDASGGDRTRETARSGSVEQRVIRIVAEQFGVKESQITGKTAFVKDLGGDSLDCVELVMEMEDEFDILVPDDEAEKLQTVEQVVECVKRLQKR